MVVSDFRINSGVRSCLARHWVDLQQLSFGSFRGVVRISGRLCHLGEGSSAALRAADVEVLETEIRRFPGVANVFFELSNWKKSAGGEWESLDRSVQGSGSGGFAHGGAGCGCSGYAGSTDGGLADGGSGDGPAREIVLEFHTRNAVEREAGETTEAAERKKP
jgi:hypothetical protein